MATNKTLLDQAKGYEIVWPKVAPLFTATLGLLDASYVYVIGEHEDQGPVKIGVAQNPIRRLRSMQTGNPRRLRIEHVLLGDRTTEKLLHELWEPYAITSVSKRNKVGAAPGTEWFRSEVRPHLFPIVETAADAQVQLLHPGGPVTVEDMERVIRQAHVAHDFVAKGREKVRLLAPVAGYINAARPSRI